MLTELALVLTTGTTGITGVCAWRFFRRLRTDPLTGLANRAALYARFTWARRFGRPVAVLLGDVDQFKAVNDTHGHRFGDQVLITIADTLSRTARRGELPVRLHGDEFAVLLTTTADPHHRAQAFQAAVDSTTEVDGQPVEVGISLGVAVAPDTATGLSALLASADDRMYGDKHHRRTPAPTVRLPELTRRNR
ncbi:GGDEF domain-containing protein [Saccharopolyspora cebuensis]|uniref:GGDEF domain-containing protein n=1 Tax=Saccharopolyspora cebuensis TaxID=418759 RepID=A0ABV4CGN5_9PSEU